MLVLAPPPPPPNPGLELETLRATAVDLCRHAADPARRNRAETTATTPSAIRFVVEGTGAFTLVDGDRCPMEKGDLILTPAGLWHEHGHHGEGPAGLARRARLAADLRPGGILRPGGGAAAPTERARRVAEPLPPRRAGALRGAGSAAPALPAAAAIPGRRCVRRWRRSRRRRTGTPRCGSPTSTRRPARNACRPLGFLRPDAAPGRDAGAAAAVVVGGAARDRGRGHRGDRRCRALGLGGERQPRRADPRAADAGEPLQYGGGPSCSSSTMRRCSASWESTRCFADAP